MKRVYCLRIFMIIGVIFGIIIAQEDMNSIGQGSKISKSGTTSMNFLQVGVSPNIAGRGNTYTAVCRGVESVFGNPAGLTELSTPIELFFSSTKWIADINYLASALAIKAGNLGVFGLHFLTVDYGYIQATALTHPEVGEENYRIIGEAKNVGAYSIGLSYVRQINIKFSMGGTVKYVSQSLGQLIDWDTGEATDNDRGKVAFDLGLRYYFGWKSLSLSMAMRNFSTYVLYQRTSFSLPLVYSIGLSMDLIEVIKPELRKLHSLLLITELSHPNNYYQRINAGVEYNYKSLFSLRAGYESNHDLLSWSIGAGTYLSVGKRRLEVNYSYSDVKLFNGVSRLSLTIGL
ncbi:MAG: PorV/PorQ family protein [Candidatus Marinimicrobia bacterium]|nr:PorV/PorQ family protein [Candidatus Neomarinimicrobiota bacterium]